MNWLLEGLMYILSTVGALLPIGRFELGPLFAEAQVHLTVFAGAIAVLGGLGYWATKIVGRPLPESAVRTTAVILLLGTVLYGLTDALSGAFGNDAEKVTLFVGAGARDKDISDFQRNVSVDIEKGAPPADAAETRAKGAAPAKSDKRDKTEQE